jgi:hypothetical protein
MTRTEQTLVIRLSGPGWRADLAVAPPVDSPWRYTEFDVPPSAKNAPPQIVSATVLYTKAENRLTNGWGRWHVKVYRCHSVDDTEKLRRYLRQQATNIQRANADLPGPTRIPIDPPWAVVPVHIVRCDGEEETLGTVRTELAIPTEPVIARVRAILPSWFDDDPPAPERYLLAISPLMEPLRWDPHRSAPGTEHLAAFRGMAAGLDTLHRLGTVHSDIKPDNVCRYGTYQVSGYVLIDLDAVTQTEPAPVTVRATPLYAYRGLKYRQHNAAVRGLGIDAGVLKAHDRFGFALVVLTALAGRDWVEQVLLRAQDDDPHGRRFADEPAAVAAALRRLWPDTPTRRWRELIQTLAEPFGPVIEAADWSAADWVERLIRAERRCVVPAQAPEPLPRGPVEAYRAELEGIRTRARAVPTRRPDTDQQGYRAIEAVALRVAVREAVRSLLLWSGALTAATVMFLISWLWLQK